MITAKDIPGENRYGKIIRDIPVLASDKVRSYADAVALVVAETYEIANKAVATIEVTYDELPSIFDAAQSLDAEAAQIHPKGNLLYEFNIVKGDADDACRPDLHC